MKLATIGLSLFVTVAAEAQMLTPGAAPYPSPPFLGGFVGGSTTVVMPQQCVIATPMAGNSVMLTPCPPGLAPQPVAPTALPPQPTQLPAPPPIPPVATPLPAPDRPIVIQILPPPVAEPKEEPPAPAAKPAPKAAPKAAPGAKKPCAC